MATKRPHSDRWKYQVLPCMGAGSPLNIAQNLGPNEKIWTSLSTSFRTITSVTGPGSGWCVSMSLDIHMAQLYYHILSCLHIIFIFLDEKWCIFILCVDEKCSRSIWSSMWYIHVSMVLLKTWRCSKILQERLNVFFFSKTCWFERALQFINFQSFSLLPSCSWKWFSLYSYHNWAVKCHQVLH
jgi:hypothetical protein